MTHAERTQAAIRERIAELQDAQFNRASVIEKALKTFEKNIRIRNVGDYTSLIQMQRRMIGIPDKTEVTHAGEVKLVTEDQASRMAEEFLKRGKKGKA